ncbi:hypothetical protein [Phormidium tenue]|jgi:hypothetical protein|uniref:Uncharacterized protein n=1 Tax=Phormidium tenue FACHB-1050 TaxID=2692857 RepID=A0ABR8CGJ9_9CYAN|nr:hypothetical protein [Phormidium tenue]MBD2319495.1 hypothetical protein [Phormidium tenue FACHB-1050]
MTIQELCDIEAQDLTKDLGYSFERKWLNLSQYRGDLDRILQINLKQEDK